MRCCGNIVSRDGFDVCDNCGLVFDRTYVIEPQNQKTQPKVVYKLRDWKGATVHKPEKWVRLFRYTVYEKRVEGRIATQVLCLNIDVPNRITQEAIKLLNTLYKKGVRFSGYTMTSIGCAAVLIMARKAGYPLLVTDLPIKNEKLILKMVKFLCVNSGEQFRALLPHTIVSRVCSVFKQSQRVEAEAINLCRKYSRRLRGHNPLIVASAAMLACTNEVCLSYVADHFQISKQSLRQNRALIRGLVA